MYLWRWHWRKQAYNVVWHFDNDARYWDTVEFRDIGSSSSVAIMHLTREWLHVNRGLLFPQIFSVVFVFDLMWVWFRPIFFEQNNTTRTPQPRVCFSFLRSFPYGNKWLLWFRALELLAALLLITLLLHFSESTK